MKEEKDESSRMQARMGRLRTDLNGEAERIVFENSKSQMSTHGQWKGDYAKGSC